PRGRTGSAPRSGSTPSSSASPPALPCSWPSGPASPPSDRSRVSTPPTTSASPEAAPVSEPRRFPGLVGWLALLLLAGSILGAWWFTRPSGDVHGQNVVPAEEPEVVCTGRVGVESPVAALEPNIPGRVVRLYVAVDKGKNK